MMDYLVCHQFRLCLVYLRNFRFGQGKKEKINVYHLLFTSKKDSPGLNFINVLHTAFTLKDPESVKRY